MARRQTDMAAIEAELQRLQGLVNTYDDKTPEMVTRRVQSKAFKKRPAQQYFTIEVVSHAELACVSLLVACCKAATLSDAEMMAEWQGQYKVEHRFRLVNQRFVVTPL